MFRGGKRVINGADWDWDWIGSDWDWIGLDRIGGLIFNLVFLIVVRCQKMQKKHKKIANIREGLKFMLTLA